MPKMDGWQVCREIRSYSKVPIIMLTARSDEKDELQGFDLGVDEYISKPFSPKILVARVEAILRRTGKSAQENEVLDVGGIHLDKAAHMVEIDGRNVDLSYKDGQKVVFFPADGQLSTEFAEENNLLRKKDENGNNIGGYMDSNKRNITAINLRGERSEGLVLPVECLSKYTNVASLKDGDQISVLNGVELCKKYIPQKLSLIHI